MRLLGRLAGWVGAGLEQLRRLMDAPMLWQGGFGALQATIEGWLAGSQGAALAIASILFVVGCIVKFVPGVSRRMREMGMETLENGLFIVGIVAMGGAIFGFVVSVAQAFKGEGVDVKSPWR